MQSPSLSLITAVYNAEKTIQETLDSVLKQTVFSDYDIEHIIVDGNSTDNTMGIVRKYAKRYPHIKYKSETDKGIYDAFNKGLKLAKGNVIGIINADDYYCENTFEHIINSFKNNNIDFVHGDMIIEYNNKGSKKNIHSKPNLKKYAHYLFMPFNHPTCFFKSSVYSQIGEFDTNYQIAGDHEFILRTLKAGKQALYIPEILAVHRYGGASTEHLAFKERVTIRVKNGIPLPLSYIIVAIIDAKRLLKQKINAH